MRVKYLGLAIFTIATLFFGASLGTKEEVSVNLNLEYVLSSKKFNIVDKENSNYLILKDNDSLWLYNEIENTTKKLKEVNNKDYCITDARLNGDNIIWVEKSIYRQDNKFIDNFKYPGLLYNVGVHIDKINEENLLSVPIVYSSYEINQNPTFDMEKNNIVISYIDSDGANNLFFYDVKQSAGVRLEKVKDNISNIDISENKIVYNIEKNNEIETMLLEIKDVETIFTFKMDKTKIFANKNIVDAKILEDKIYALNKTGNFLNFIEYNLISKEEKIILNGAEKNIKIDSNLELSLDRIYIKSKDSNGNNYSFDCNTNKIFEFESDIIIDKILDDSVIINKNINGDIIKEIIKIE